MHAPVVIRTARAVRITAVLSDGLRIASNAVLESPCLAKGPGYVFAIATPIEHTIFLLSPANLGGARGEIVLRPEAASPLACELRSGGVPLGELFSFVSSLYFRGKVAYASAFARPPADAPGALVITPGEGLLALDERVNLDRLRTWATIAVDARNHRFTDPLLRQAVTLLRTYGATTRFVLLGSVASKKYVDPLVRAFGYRLFFSARFRWARRHEPRRIDAPRGERGRRADLQAGCGDDTSRAETRAAHTASSHSMSPSVRYRMRFGGFGRRPMHERLRIFDPTARHTTSPCRW